MRLYLLIFALFAMPFILEAQDLVGIIDYEQTHQRDFEVTPEMRARMGEIPKERTRKKQLHFDQNGSIFKNAPRDKNAEMGRGRGGRGGRGGGRRGGRGGRGDHKYYKGFENNNIIMQRSIMGKTFLIEEESKMHPWKMTGQQKEILGYTCMQAVTMEDSIEIVAWFAPEIPVSIGPDDINTLPGAVLAVDKNQGKEVTVATKVELNPEYIEKIEAPSKGEKVSMEEFEKIREEKMQQMKEMYGDKGPRHHRRGQ